MVLRSLRSRLIGAFGLIVLLMILLSGALSIWATTSRFDILVTEESRQRAREFVPLLEGSYDHRGGWSGLDGLLTTTPSEVFDTIWYDTEWWGEVATALGVDNQTLVNLAEDADSLAAVAEAQGVDPDALVQAIVESERAGVDAAVALGHLMPGQVEDELASLRKNAVEQNSPCETARGRAYEQKTGLLLRLCEKTLATTLRTSPILQTA